MLKPSSLLNLGDLDTGQRIIATPFFNYFGCVETFVEASNWHYKWLEPNEILGLN